MNSARIVTIVWALAAALVLTGAYLLVPAQHRPFAHFDLEDPVGFFTSARLAHLRAAPEACRAAVAASDLDVAATPDVEERGFCALRDAVTLTRSMHPYSETTRLSCPLAAALYIWERDVLAPAALKHLGIDVAQIEVLGTYSCRRIAGRSDRRASNHATGEAIDITGFTLSNGEAVRVERDWSGDTAKSRFLHAIRSGGCMVFQGVLSPDYNAAHRNHFHFDMGDERLCR